MYRPARFPLSFVVLIACATSSLISIILQKLADLFDGMAITVGDPVDEWAKRKLPRPSCAAHGELMRDLGMPEMVMDCDHPTLPNDKDEP